MLITFSLAHVTFPRLPPVTSFCFSSDCLVSLFCKRVIKTVPIVISVLRRSMKKDAF